MDDLNNPTHYQQDKAISRDQLVMMDAELYEPMARTLGDETTHTGIEHLASSINIQFFDAHGNFVHAEARGELHARAQMTGLGIEETLLQIIVANAYLVFGNLHEEQEKRFGNCKGQKKQKHLRVERMAWADKVALVRGQIIAATMADLLGNEYPRTASTTDDMLYRPPALKGVRPDKGEEDEEPADSKPSMRGRQRRPRRWHPPRERDPHWSDPASGADPDVLEPITADSDSDPLALLAANERHREVRTELFALIERDGTSKLDLRLLEAVWDYLDETGEAEPSITKICKARGWNAGNEQRRWTRLQHRWQQLLRSG